MTSARRAVIVVAILLVAKVAGAGPIFAGSEYEVRFAEGLTWSQARTAAQALGGGWDLATIGTLAENNFVEGLLSTALSDRSHFWIGATDTATEGVWQWIDATPFVFTDWWGGEPNNVGDEDFLAYDLRSGSWAWNDAGSSALSLVRGYVTERVAPAAVPEPATLSLLGLGMLGLARRRRTR